MPCQHLGRHHRRQLHRRRRLVRREHRKQLRIHRWRHARAEHDEVVGRPQHAEPPRVQRAAAAGRADGAHEDLAVLPHHLSTLLEADLALAPGVLGHPPRVDLTEAVRLQQHQDGVVHWSLRGCDGEEASFQGVAREESGAPPQLVAVGQSAFDNRAEHAAYQPRPVVDICWHEEFPVLPLEQPVDGDCGRQARRVAHLRVASEPAVG
mmetsp:Transcript_88470/g.270811  ORF Transcript_88470/g.270811 Transcript_88470/m.270811 type:complete len:208 (-) Transcript_88470:1683-2306(-)